MEESQPLPSRIQYWLTEAKHDCYFVVGFESGPTERIGAMKTFLLGYSEPFRAMLQDSDLAEKGDIRLKDVEPETFRNFLKCVYGASSLVISQLSFEECANLLYVAEKYLVNDIKAEISERLLSLFSFDNVFFALSHPIIFQNETLKEVSLDFVRKNFDKIMTDERFLKLHETAVIQMLQIPPKSISTLKEIDIWKIILQWAKLKTDSTDNEAVRSHMFKILKHIRFLAMDFTDFCREVVTSDILLNEEVYEICKSFGTGNPHNIEHLCSNKQTRFNHTLSSSNITSNFIGCPKYAFIHWLIRVMNEQPSLYIMVYPWAEQAWLMFLRKIKYDNKDFVSAGIRVMGRTPEWMIAASVTINLTNQNGKADMCVKKVIEFKESSPIEHLILYPWNALFNPRNGFVKDNTIIVTCQIQLLNS